MTMTTLHRISLSFSTFIIATLALPLISFAQAAPTIPPTLPPSSGPGPGPEFARATSTAASSTRLDNREAVRTQLRERAQARITNLAANVSTRMENTARRFEQIIGRLDARIAILADRGVDTVAAENQLEIAKGALADAKASLSTIDADVRDAVGAADMKTAWQSVRTTYATARGHLLRTHEALRATVATLKDAVRAADSDSGVSDATPSTENEPTTE